jgi:transposase
MSLQPKPCYEAPEETARVARAAFPQGTLCTRIYDALGTIFQDADFVPIFPPQGQPAETPVRLALATIMQFVECLSDRAAADAVRSRIDWKYLLCLELTDSGFDHTVLSEFRARMLKAGAEQLLFETLLTKLREKGLLKARGRQRTDSTHVLAAVRAMNRLECVVETMRHALNCLAIVAPEWLREHSPAEWIDRYGARADDYRMPTTKDKREAYANVIGIDGWKLLTDVYASEAPPWLREVPAVETLRQVWVQQYIYIDGAVRWRDSDNTPPSARMISSPYDSEAHYARKRSTSWIGYKAHLTETCDEERPNLITHVETTAAPTSDSDAVEPIHEALEKKDLLPGTHFVDAGYVEAKLLVSISREYGVDLYGPTRADYHWQSQAGRGFDAESFCIDWEKQQAICPEGKTSLSWTPAIDHTDNDVIKIKFSSFDCKPCPSRINCTTSKRLRRTVTIRPKEAYEALQAGRRRQQSEEFKEQHKKRAGVEGTISQAVRAFGMRRSRYRGMAKTHLQHVLTAVAINIVRISEWLIETPRAATRTSHFERLMAMPSPAK